MRSIFLAWVLLIAACAPKTQALPVADLDPVVRIPKQDVGHGARISVVMLEKFVFEHQHRWPWFVNCIGYNIGRRGVESDPFTSAYLISDVVLDRVRNSLTTQNFRLVERNDDPARSLSLGWRAWCHMSRGLLEIRFDLWPNADIGGPAYFGTFTGMRSLDPTRTTDGTAKLESLEAAMADAIRQMVLDSGLTTFLATGNRP